MDKQDLEKFLNLDKKLKQINNKFKLLNLLRTAKEEYDKNLYEDCIETCKKALETNPKNSVALRGLGCSMQSLGKIEEAIEYYLSALEFSKNKEIEYTLLGTVFYSIGDLEKAIDYYNLAIDINDDYEMAYEGKNQAMLENHLKIIDLQDLLIQSEFDSNNTEKDV